MQTAFEKSFCIFNYQRLQTAMSLTNVFSFTLIKSDEASFIQKLIQNPFLRINSSQKHLMLARPVIGTS